MLDAGPQVSCLPAGGARAPAAGLAPDTCAMGFSRAAGSLPQFEGRLAHLESRASLMRQISWWSLDCVAQPPSYPNSKFPAVFAKRSTVVARLASLLGGEHYALSAGAGQHQTMRCSAATVFLDPSMQALLLFWLPLSQLANLAAKAAGLGAAGQASMRCMQRLKRAGRSVGRGEGRVSERVQRETPGTLGAPNKRKPRRANAAYACAAAAAAAAGRPSCCACCCCCCCPACCSAAVPSLSSCRIMRCRSATAASDCSLLSGVLRM